MELPVRAVNPWQPQRVVLSWPIRRDTHVPALAEHVSNLTLEKPSAALLPLERRGARLQRHLHLSDLLRERVRTHPLRFKPMLH